MLPLLLFSPLITVFFSPLITVFFSPLIIVFFLTITQLDEQLHGAVEVIGKVERDCSLSSQRIIPYDQEFGECFSSNFFLLKKGCLENKGL